MGQTLSSPLVAGQRYYGEFWVSLASLSRLSARQLGLHVSAVQLTPPDGGVVLAPSISGTPGPFPNTNDTGWHRINGFFTAAGGERFITLGCFLPDGNGTDNFANGIYPVSGGGGFYGAYYFYDDILMVKVPDAGLPVTASCSSPATIGAGCPVPAALGATYQWAPTAGLANSTQLVTQASPTVATTYTLTVTIGGISTQSSVVVNVTSSGAPVGAVAIGTPNTITTLSGGMGNVTYSGNYLVQGDLLLTDGTFTLTPGTTFYFNNVPEFDNATLRDEPVGKIIVGSRATLRLNNATMRGACNSWFGIVLSQNQYVDSRLIIENSSTIANAKYGVYAEPLDRINSPSIVYDTKYTLTDSRFSNNWTHVYDESRHKTPASACDIRRCTFTSNAQQMLPPYDNPTSNSYNNQITYQALYINPYTYGDVFPDPLTPANSGRVIISGNTISTAVYGILNNRQDRGFVSITDNQLTNIYGTGIWKSANPGYSVDYNRIRLNGSRAVRTAQINPNHPVVGIDAEVFSITDGSTLSHNSVTGDNAQDLVNYREQVGIIAPYPAVAVRDNTLTMLSAGATYRHPNVNLFNNRFTNCLTGLKLLPYDQTFSNYLMGPPRVECNTFERSSGFTATTYGIWAMPRIPAGATNNPQRDAYLADLGTLSRPCGNTFTTTSVAVQNDGNNANAQYYRFDTPQETVIGGGQLSVFTSSVPFAGACQSRGATSPANGVNRQANGFAYMQSIMDSVRWQRVSPRRQEVYQGQIIQYFVGQSQLAGLEQYATTLPASNRMATYGFNRYLMQAQAGQRQKSQTRRARQRLAPLAAANTDLRQELAFFDVLERAERWPAAGSRLPAADSVALVTIATSETTVAESAAAWLRYYYPHAAPNFRASVVPTVSASAVSVGNAPIEAALYPNPSSGTAIARYQPAKAGQAVGLQVVSLLTSKEVLFERLPTTGRPQGYEEHSIDVHRLPAGQYIYRFIVDGKPQTAHHFVIQR